MSRQSHRKIAEEIREQDHHRPEHQPRGFSILMPRHEKWKEKTLRSRSLICCLAGSQGLQQQVSQRGGCEARKIVKGRKSGRRKLRKLPPELC